MAISVVVTSYNLEKEGILKAILDNYCRQTKQPDEYILADAQSEDNTQELVEAYKDKLPIELVVKPNRDGWCSWLMKYGVDHARGDILVIDHAERLMRLDYIERMTNNLASDEWRYAGCKWIYDSLYHREPFPYNNGDNCIDRILALPTEEQFDYALKISHAYTTPISNKFCMNAAWTAAFHRSMWDKIIGEIPQMDKYGPDDEWYQRRIFSEENSNLNAIHEPLLIHLYHTRYDHKYFRHPTKTWRDYCSPSYFRPHEVSIMKARILNKLLTEQKGIQITEMRENAEEAIRIRDEAKKNAEMLKQRADDLNNMRRR